MRMRDQWKDNMKAERVGPLDGKRVGSLVGRSVRSLLGCKEGSLDLTFLMGPSNKTSASLSKYKENGLLRAKAHQACIYYLFSWYDLHAENPHKMIYIVSSSH